MFTLITALFALCMPHALSAKITHGSKDSAIVAAGGTFSLAAPLPVTDGAFRVTSDTTLSGTIAGTRARIEVADGTVFSRMLLTGDYNIDTGQVSLNESGDNLTLIDGQTKLGVTVSQDATVQGSGSFGGPIEVASGKTLSLAVAKTVNQTIHNAGTVELHADTKLAGGVWFTSNAGSGGSVLTGGTLKGNGKVLSLGSDSLSLAVDQNWNDVALEMNGPVSLEKKITLQTTGSSINGNGFPLTLSDSSAEIDLNSKQLSLTDLIVTNMSSNLLSNPGTLSLTNVLFKDDSNGLLRVNACAEVNPEGNGNFFKRNVTWNKNATVELLENTSLSDGATWKMGPSGEGISLTLVGNGNALDCAGGTLNANTQDIYIHNTTLTGMRASSLTAGGLYHFADVTVFNEFSPFPGMRISGVSDDSTQSPAAATVSNGDFFSGTTIWSKGVSLELLSNVALAENTTWQFDKDAVIDAKGHVFDLSANNAKIVIGNGKTLTLRNMVFKGWGGSNGVGNPVGGQVVFAGADEENSGGRLKLHNVTVILDGDVTIAPTADSGSDDTQNKEYISIDGPVTFVTGAHTFDASKTSANNNIDDVTVWYDTTGTVDKNNVTFGSSFQGGGRIMPVAYSKRGSIILNQDITDLSSTEFLYHHDGDVAGRTITFETANQDMVVHGHGRSLIMAKHPSTAASDDLLTVSGSGTVTLRDVTLEGLHSAYINHGAESGALVFGSQTHLVLNENDSLLADYTFYDTQSGRYVLDLAGHELDLNGKKLIVDNAQDGSEFVIANGRVKGVTGSLIQLGSNNMKVVLDNAELVLSGDTTFNNAALCVRGSSSLRGAGDYTFTNTSAQPLTIESGAHFCIKTGMTYKVKAAHTIAFASRNATFSLEDATLDSVEANSPLILTHGSFEVDSTSTLNGDFALGGVGNDELDLDIKPAALLKLTNGNLSNNNPS